MLSMCVLLSERVGPVEEAGFFVVVCHNLKLTPLSFIINTASSQYPFLSLHPGYFNPITTLCFCRILSYKAGFWNIGAAASLAAKHRAGGAGGHDSLVLIQMIISPVFIPARSQITFSAIQYIDIIVSVFIPFLPPSSLLLPQSQYAPQHRRRRLERPLVTLFDNADFDISVFRQFGF